METYKAIIKPSTKFELTGFIHAEITFKAETWEQAELDADYYATRIHMYAEVDGLFKTNS